MTEGKHRDERRIESKVVPRAQVWLDMILEDQLKRLSLPDTSPAVMLRILARAAFAEIEGMVLSEGLKQIAPVAWAAVSQRRKVPSLLDRLPRYVDEYLESIGTSYATRAKAYALLLPLSPLTRLALLIYGSQMTTVPSRWSRAGTTQAVVSASPSHQSVTEAKEPENVDEREDEAPISAR